MNIENNNIPRYLIRGGTPLYGEVQISGAKNAVTKLMIASLLTNHPGTLRNVPLIGDLELTMSLCRALGSDLTLFYNTLSLSRRYMKMSCCKVDVVGLIPR